MRGVLTEEMLFVYATCVLVAKPKVAVVEDGHLTPLVSAFEWPDGSPGVMIRMEEDASGFATRVELTHVGAGRKISLDLPLFQGVGSGIPLVRVYNSYTELRAAQAKDVAVAIVLSDNINQEAGFFRRNDTSATVDDGRLYIHSADGAKFDRIERIT